MIDGIIIFGAVLLFCCCTAIEYVWGVVRELLLSACLEHKTTDLAPSLPNPTCTHSTDGDGARLNSTCFFTFVLFQTSCASAVERWADWGGTNRFFKWPSLAALKEEEEETKSCLRLLILKRRRRAIKKDLNWCADSCRFHCATRSRAADERWRAPLVFYSILWFAICRRWLAD